MAKKVLTKAMLKGTPKTVVSATAPADCCSVTKAVCVIAVVVAAVYVARYIREQMHRRAPHATAEEGFANVDSSYAIGPYDGVHLRASDPATFELHKPTRQNATVQGYQVPLRQPYPSDLAHSAHYATVDGTDNTPRDMFMFAHNQSHPECCPSTYSTSTGCVCTTPAQRRWLYMRGGKTD